MIKKSFISLAVSAALSAGSGSLFAAQTALSGDYTATQSAGVYLVNGDTSFDLTSESYPPFAAGAAGSVFSRGSGYLHPDAAGAGRHPARAAAGRQFVNFPKFPPPH